MSRAPCFHAVLSASRASLGSHFLPVGNFRPELKNLFLSAGNSVTFLLTRPLAYVLAYLVDSGALAGGVRARKNTSLTLAD